MELNEIVSKQEIEWITRVEDVLEFPRGRLIKALFHSRTLTVLEALEALFPTAEK